MSDETLVDRVKALVEVEHIDHDTYVSPGRRAYMIVVEVANWLDAEGFGVSANRIRRKNGIRRRQTTEKTGEGK